MYHIHVLVIVKKGVIFLSVNYATLLLTRVTSTILLVQMMLSNDYLDVPKEVSVDLYGFI